MHNVQKAYRRHLSSCPIPLPHATLPFGTHLMHGTSTVANSQRFLRHAAQWDAGLLFHHVEHLVSCVQKCLPAVTCSVALPLLLPLHADRLCWTRSDPKNGVRLSGK